MVNLSQSLFCDELTLLILYFVMSWFPQLWWLNEDFRCLWCVNCSWKGIMLRCYFPWKLTYRYSYLAFSLSYVKVQNIYVAWL